jgi:hypothetical protein
LYSARVSSELTRLFTDILQQLNALKTKSDDQQSAANTIAALQKELANEQFARRDASRDVEVCSKVA